MASYACLMQLSTSQHSSPQLFKLQEENPGCIHACTDITGFGFLGHLNEMLAASPTTCVDLWIEKIPSFEGALDLLKAVWPAPGPSNLRALTSLGSRVNALQDGEDVSNKLEAGLSSACRPSNLRTAVGELYWRVRPNPGRPGLERNWPGLTLSLGMQGHQTILKTRFYQLPATKPLVRHSDAVEPLWLLANAFRKDSFGVIAVGHLCSQISFLRKQPLKGRPLLTRA